MTTNTFPADRDPRILHTHDPAEMLAMSRLALARVPHDCLILIGHDGHLSHPLITRSDLSHLLADEGRDLLENHIELMRRRGCSGAFALLVLGDGYDPQPERSVDDVTGAGGARLMTTAAEMLPEPFELDAVWVLAVGAAQRLLLLGTDEEGVDLAVSPPLPLRAFAETDAAARAVLDGAPVPRAEEGESVRRLGPQLPLDRCEGPDITDLPALFADARDALARLQRAGAEPGGENFMTDCEHVSRLLTALEAQSLQWELLALCVERGQDRRIERGQLLEVLTTDPTWIPGPDVCAGGTWYRMLEQLRWAAWGAAESRTGPRRSRAGAAWRSLTMTLVLLSWWNHRFATAGELVDELWEGEPASTLAPLLARMIDTPIPPAWWPRT